MSGASTLVETPAIAASEVEFLEVAIDAVCESPDNPRKRFDPAALEQLQESLTRSGMLTPIRVRTLPAPAADDVFVRAQYMIAAGHRRYRAAKALGWTFVPVLASPMTDAQFLEVMTVDNLQRDDLHPMEEARGFALLIKELGYDIAQVAHRVGRSSSYVYDRVRLLKLTPRAQEMFSADRFPLSHAIVLSRLAPAGQELVIGTVKRSFNDGGLFRPDALREQQGDLIRATTMEEELDRLAPRSLRELESWVEDNVRFDREAKDLTELFPETAEQIAAAQAAKGKVIPVTFDHYVRDSARADERTLGPRAFREASGRGKGTPTCDHSVLGVVVVGPRRGESFPICIAKEKCTVHYATEIREKKKREKARAAADATGTGASHRAKEQEAQAKRAAAEAKTKSEQAELERRLKKATPALQAAVRETIAAAPMRVLAQLILKQALNIYGAKAEKEFNRDLADGKYDQADAIVRAIATQDLHEDVGSRWGWTDLVKNMKPFGVDMVAVLDAAAPPAPKPAPKPKAKPAAANKAKPRAGDVRRKKLAKAGAA